MSQIFDALLRSEAERVGTDEVTQAESTRLLQHVEHQVASRWGTALLDPVVPATSGQVLEWTGSNGKSAHVEKQELAGPGLVAEESGISDLLAQSRVLPIAAASESRFICLTDKESPTAEAFRLLAVRLRNLRRTRPLKRLLITSSVPREGKSTVAANLACTLSQKTEEKILLIEGDVRRPALTHMLDLNDASGICELLRGQNTLRDCLCRLSETGPWILPAGSAPDAPLELLQSEKLPALLEQVNAWFDWIIIDSPPVLPLADTSVWARMVDGILLVTRQGITEKQQLERALQALEPGKLIGALLNCSKVSTYSSYYYRSAPTS
ncbi:MAG TPA: CpsD/CapB family tyrosine-protein kinase [Terracidiphilus sp.]|jgi:capsular exopolysaccharide synthesis family protein|nr:CpsD/CapB family tyrosine-protein kinase [Terracidiphilus sp.]